MEELDLKELFQMFWARKFQIIVIVLILALIIKLIVPELVNIVNILIKESVL